MAKKTLSNKEFGNAITGALNKVIAKENKPRKSTGRQRVKIEATGKYSSEESYQATIVATNKVGSLAKSYVSKSKQAEVDNNGFAYVSQMTERIV
jgi:hypothetical protein